MLAPPPPEWNSLCAITAPMSLPIGDYALLSNCNGAALVSRGGSIDWVCLPRFDSPSVFARLLDPTGGHWSISPVDPATSSRHYVSDSMVVRTELRTRAGVVALTDALALGGGEGHEIGRGAPDTLIRIVEGIAGRVDVVVEFAPRPEYGLTTPRLTETADGVRSVGGETVLALDTSARFAIGRGTAVSRFSLS